MASVRASNPSSGGWNRTSGLRVQSAASLPASNCPGVREGGFEPPPPDSKSGSLPVSRFPRAPRGSRTRLSAWEARDRSARDASTRSSGIGESNPGRLVGSQDRAMDQSRDRRKERESNPQGSSLARFRAGCRRPSACPSVDRRAPAAGIEPASSRLTAGCSYQHELHRNRRVRQSGWPDSNRRSPAPEAGGLARLSHIPSRLVHRQVPSGSRTRTSAMARR